MRATVLNGAAIVGLVLGALVGVPLAVLALGDEAARTHAGVLSLSTRLSAPPVVEPSASPAVHRSAVLSVSTSPVEVRHSAAVSHIIARCVNSTAGVGVYIVDGSAGEVAAGAAAYCDTCVAGPTLPPLGTAYLRTSSGTASVSCDFFSTWPAGVSVGGGGSGVSLGAADARYLKIDASNDPLTGALTVATGTSATGDVALLIESANGADALQLFSIDGSGAGAIKLGNNAWLASNNLTPRTGTAGNQADTVAVHHFCESMTATACTAVASVLAGGNVHGGAGNATAPTFSFLGDTNTGAYSAGADALAWAVGGAQGMRLTPTGLAVGTGAAVEELDVTRDADTAVMALVFNDSAGVSASADLGLRIESVGEGATLRCASGAYSDADQADACTWSVSSTLAEGIKFSHSLAAGLIRFYVGLGVNAAANERLRIAASSGVVLNEPGDASADLRVESDTLTHALFLDSSADCISVGDGTCTTLLDVAGTTTTTSALVGDGAVGAPSIAFSADTNTGIFRVGADQLSLVAGGVELVRVDNDAGANRVSIIGSGGGASLRIGEDLMTILGQTLIDPDGNEAYYVNGELFAEGNAGGYTYIIQTGTGDPPAGDCDHDSERGRLAFELDAATPDLFVCQGATDGWANVGLTASLGAASLGGGVVSSIAGLPAIHVVVVAVFSSLSLFFAAALRRARARLDRLEAIVGAP